MKRTIHVHQQAIKKNDPVNHPAIIVRTYQGSAHYNAVAILDSAGVEVARIVHSAEPDRCGARVVITTESEVVPL